jgi:hypothetical protein
MGRRLTNFAVFDDESAEGMRITLDEAGTVANEHAFLAQEQGLYEQKFGRADPSLARRLELLPDETILDIALTMRVPDDPTPWEDLLDKTDAQAERVIAQRNARWERLAQVAVQPVIHRLNALGIVSDWDGSSPRVTFQATVGQVRYLVRWPEVQSAGVIDGEPKQRLFYRRNTRNVPYVQDTLGFWGSGVTIGLVDLGGGRVMAPSEPYWYGDQFPPPLWGTQVTQNNPYGCGVNNHGVEMIGLLQGKKPSPRWVGFAPRAQIYVDGPCEQDRGTTAENRTYAATDRALKNGARILNFSWGIQDEAPQDSRVTQMDQNMDRYAWTNRVTIISAAGQDNGGYIDSPALGYNVITVGAFDDKRSPNMLDDSLWGLSNWRDPASWNSDRNKPELVAPGISLYAGSRIFQNRNQRCPDGPDAYECDWLRAASGTSGATALVTGIAALAMSANSALKYQPEAMKAILLASTFWDAANFDFDKVGAGSPYADWAASIASGRAGTWGVINNFAGSVPSYLDIPLPWVRGGSGFNAAVAWGVNPDNTSYYPSRPECDVMIVLMLPKAGGGYTAVPPNFGSFDRNWDAVFEAYSEADGYPKIRVINYNRCTVSNIPLGYAAGWWHW